VRWASCNIYST
jgi:adenosylhomocysteinase